MSDTEPSFVAIRYLARGLPEGHSARSLADVVVAKTQHGWRVGDDAGWVGPGGKRVSEPVTMDLETAREAALVEAETLAAAVLAVHPR
ncbi:hypothetical protein ACWFPY_35070 [Nocardia fluminea]